MKISLKNQEFEKSKVASNQTCVTVEWYIGSKKADNNGISLLLMCEPSQQNVHLKQNENLKVPMN